MNNPPLLTKLINQYEKTADQCNYSLIRHPAVSMKEQLTELADSLSQTDSPDIYGSGQLIEDFEREVADLLGMEDGVFLVSGTMAQPMALRIWSEHKRSPWFAMPPTSHLELHEHKGYQALHGLNPVFIGQRDQVPTLSDLKQITDPVSAVVLELPMREIGGQLPEWDELKRQSEWARSSNIAMHMDGARLWQTGSAYNRPLSEITALFDSVYVSFYKDLGGIAGSMLLGPKWFVESARIWSRRCGGNIYSYYPYILAAKAGLHKNLGNIPEANRAARTIAREFNRLPTSATTPEHPTCNMFHLIIRGTPEKQMQTIIEWTDKTKVALLPKPREIRADAMVFELNFGRACGSKSSQFWIDQIQSMNARLLANL